MNDRLRIFAISLLAVLLLCVTGFVYRPTPQQWEYKFVQMKLDFKKTDVALNELGAQGWEAYAVNEENGIADFYLKRPK